MPTAVSHELVQQSLIGEALDGGPVAVFVADDDGKFLAVNAYACELLGYEREELLGLRVTDLAVNEAVEDNFGELRRRRTHSGLTILRRKDGSELTMNFRASETTVSGMVLYIGACWPVAG